MQKIIRKNLKEIIRLSLQEDQAFQDITSDLIIDQNQKINFNISNREKIIFCGKEIIKEVFLQLKKSVKFRDSFLRIKINFKDGEEIAKNSLIACGKGDAKLVFAAERVMLNLLQHLSGIASLTNEFVKKLNNQKIKILDTRKTTPCLRMLEKYAVVCGGGKNHRMNLSDMILIKDNHIAVCGGVKVAIEKVKKSNKKVEIECDNYQQVLEAIDLKPDIIMLDNMTKNEIKKSIDLIRKKQGNKISIEVSGGINLKNIKFFSDIDINFISIGSITNSAKAVDIGLDTPD
jgi:nicotinate-nucleotide pyrophosphorylase (carboxylating)